MADTQWTKKTFTLNTVSGNTVESHSCTGDEERIMQSLDICPAARKNTAISSSEPLLTHYVGRQNPSCRSWYLAVTAK